MEEYRGVVGYEDIFKVSNKGSVFSIRTNRLLKTVKNKKGYLTISTKIGGRHGKNVCLKVHRIVAEAFIKNPEKKKQVNHKDCDKTNNCVENLEWSTAKENVLHAISNGRCTYHIGEDNKSSKLTKDDILKIRTRHIRGCRKNGARALSREFHVSHNTVLDIVHKKSWARF